MPINIIDVDEFTDPITAPAGADPANAASVVDPIQKLANRTRHLLNRALSGYALSRVVVYEASGIWTKPDGVRAVRVIVVGGGGGGGGGPVSPAVSAGGGGGGGATAIKWIDAPLASETVIVGAGGAGGVNYVNGANGGASSFGAHVSAGGGGGGPRGEDGELIVSGGNGGTGATGDINIRGSDGGPGLVLGSDVRQQVGGYGGASYLAGAALHMPISNAGNDGKKYGGGGAGGRRYIGQGAPPAWGGNGADGVVIVEEYI